MFSWLKSASARYLSHLSGYLMGACTIISGVNPKLLPPQISWIVAIGGIVMNAAHHGYTLANASPVLQQTIQAALKAALDTAKTATNTAAIVGKGVTPFLLLPILLAVGGCATFQSWLGSPTGEAVTIAGVKIAVTTAEQKGVSAAQLNSVARSIIADVQSTTVTLATISTALNAELVKLKVPQGDVDAFQGLEIAFDAYVAAKYGNSPTIQNLEADIVLFCNQVILDTGGAI